MPKLIGYIVVARPRGERGAWKTVSNAYQIKSAAEQFLAMYERAFPTHEVYVSSQVKGEKG